MLILLAVIDIKLVHGSQVQGVLAISAELLITCTYTLEGLPQTQGVRGRHGIRCAILRTYNVPQSSMIQLKL